MEETMMVELTETVERLATAAGALEKIAASLDAQQASFAAAAEETVGRIVATVESAREAELERKLAEAEAKIAALQASSQVGRKTLPAGVARMLAKEGVAGESFDAAALDAALGSLSIEQRIAVKSELLRAGMVG